MEADSAHLSVKRNMTSSILPPLLALLPPSRSSLHHSNCCRCCCDLPDLNCSVKWLNWRWVSKCYELKWAWKRRNRRTYTLYEEHIDGWSGLVRLSTLILQPAERMDEGKRWQKWFFQEKHEKGWEVVIRRTNCSHGLLAEYGSNWLIEQLQKTCSSSALHRSAAVAPLVVPTVVIVFSAAVKTNGAKKKEWNISDGIRKWYRS